VKRLVVILLVAGTLTLAGCGSGSPGESPEAVGHKVLTILIPRHPVPEKVDAVTASTAEVDIGSQAQRIYSLRYPPQAKTDAVALFRILDTLSLDNAHLALEIRAHPADIQAVHALFATIRTAQAVELADANALLHRLGLPPVTTLTR
jgi:hypothetical protein